MGLEQVIGEVRRDGDQRAQKVLDDAQAEADRILSAAREKVEQLGQERSQQAQRDGEQLQAQMKSHAQFEARKRVLATEAELREELRQAVMDAFDGLSKDARKAHIERLFKQAKDTIPEGKVFGAAKDEAALKAGPYALGGTLDVAGGIVVDSEDGHNRLDLSYETLASDLWRDILRQEAELFG